MESYEFKKTLFWNVRWTRNGRSILQYTKINSLKSRIWNYFVKAWQVQDHDRTGGRLGAIEGFASITAKSGGGGAVVIEK